MRIFVNTISVFERERIIIIILCGNSVVELTRTFGICLLSKIVLVVIVFNEASFGGFTVMDRCLNSWSHKSDPCHDTLNLDKLVYQIRFQSAWRDIISTDITLEVHIICRHLLWKIDIRVLSLRFLTLLLLFKCSN